MLVDVPTYQRVTKDTATSSGDVTTALTDALAMVDQECKRTFAYAASVTETLDVNIRGLVYPSRFPVISVASPAGATVREGGIYLGAVSSWPTPFTPLPAQSTVTYAGGYNPYDTGDPVIPDLPVKLMRVVCRIAWLALHPLALPGVPAGAKSASIGDVSISGDLSSFAIVDPSIERDLKGFRRRSVGVLL